jgi:alpha-1,6-mannosyltransferase
MAETLVARTRSLRGLVLCGILLELSLLLLYLVPAGGPAVIACMVVHGIVYLLLAALWWRRDNAKASSPAAITVILAFGILFRLTLVPHMPVCSDDIYRYLWDGKVAAHGINPYAYPPNDVRLAHLASPLLPGAVNHPSIGTVYPPLAQAFFVISYLLVGEHVAGFKALLTLVDIGTLFLLIWLLRVRKRPPEEVILYAWSPLPLLYGALDGHIDILGIPFLVLLLLLAARGRFVLSSFASAAAGLVKILPIVLVPLYIRQRPGWRGVVVAGTALLAFGIAFLPYRSDLSALGHWLSIYGQHWEFNGGLFTVIFAWLQDNQKTHLVLNVLLLAWMAWLTVRTAPLTESVFLALLGLVIFGPVVHPWYLLWLAAMLVVRWSPSVFVFLGLSALANVVEYRYLTTGRWVDDPWLIALQYLPFAALLLWEWRHGPAVVSSRTV